MMETGNDTIPVVRLASPGFAIASHADSALLIQIDATTLTYAVVDTISNTTLAFCKQPLQINSYTDLLSEATAILTTDEWLRMPFAEVKLVVKPRDYVLVPKDLFDPLEIATYLGFHVYGQLSTSLLFDSMDALGVVGVYHLPSQGVEAMNRLFPQLAIWATPSPFLQLATKEHKPVKGDCLLTLFTQTHLHLAVAKQGSLVFYNSFEVATKEDVTYYSLAVCEQLHLSPEKIQVVMWGTHDSIADPFVALSYYFKNVQHGARPLALKFAEALDSLPIYNEYPLFAAALCE